MINIMVSKTLAVVSNNETLTSGMVGAKVQFAFSEDWNELSKMAVFKAGDVTKSVLQSAWSDGVCTIPHEVLSEPCEKLFIGVYGTDASNNIVVPTIWASACEIRKGVDGDAEASTDPTLPVWSQMQSQIGDLSELETTNKTNLVSAINEVNGKSGSATQVSNTVVIEGTLNNDVTEVTISTPDAWQMVHDAWNDESHPLVMLRLDGEMIAYLNAVSIAGTASGELGVAIFSVPPLNMAPSTPPYCVWLHENGTAYIVSALDDYMSSSSTGAVENKTIKAYVDEQVGNINALLATI